MENEIAFVVMAAGVGRRYGGEKQLETFGEKKLTIAEYNMLHAIEAGFRRFYFVISDKLAETFFKRLQGFMPQNCEFGLIYQKHEEQLTRFCNRTKPWGTAHAVMCCASAVGHNFCTANADDLYGRDAIFRMAEFLRATDSKSKIFANVAYTLSETLPDEGTVSRGVIAIDENSYLESIKEVHGLSMESLGNLQILADSLVSMNLWGFTPEVFSLLKAAWGDFKKNIAEISTDEFGLPGFANREVASGGCKIKVLCAGSKWCGITYQSDKKSVESFLSK